MEELSGYASSRLNDALDSLGGESLEDARTTARVLGKDANGTIWVRFDGSTERTPLTGFTASVSKGDRISVSRFGLEVIADGNYTDPSAGKSDIAQANVKIENITSSFGEFEKLTTRELEAEKARIGDLEADTAKIHSLTAEEISAATAYIADLDAGNVTAANIIADHGDFATVKANAAKVQNLTAAELEADHATIGSLDSNFAHIDLANVDNAWIDSGVIKDGAITSAQILGLSANKLTAGTINGNTINVTNLNADNITAGTLNGQRIGTGSLSLDKLSEDVYTEAEVDSMLSDMQDEIDGAIETWTGTDVPTLNNAPASSWATSSDKDKHVGDVYFVVNSQSQQNGYNYRFTKSGSTYSWQLIKDSDVTNALQRLQTAEGQITQFDSDITQLQTDTGSLATRATSLETRMTTAEGDISDKVDTATFNELSSTVDGNSASITTLSTTVSQKADSSTVTTLSNTVNTVSQTASGNSTKLSQLTTTLGTNADGTTKTGDIVHRMSSTEQDLSGFKTTVSSTYATKQELDDLEIGGRNLLQGTADPKSDGTSTPPYWKVTSGGNGVGSFETVLDSPVPSVSKAFRITGNSSGNRDWQQYVTDLQNTWNGSSWDDVTWTFSAYVRAIGSSCTALIRCYSSHENFKFSKTVGTSWERITCEVKLSGNQTSDFTAMQFGIGGAGSIEYIAPKLERGNKATDWTAAPEDIEGRVTQAETSISQTANAIGLTASGSTTIANPNLTPWFSSMPLSSSSNEYWHYVSNLGVVTDMGDGWLRFQYTNSTSSTTRALEMGCAVSPSVKQGGTYTWLVEMRNNSSTITSGGFCDVYLVQTNNNQFWGGTAAKSLDDGTSSARTDMALKLTPTVNPQSGYIERTKVAESAGSTHWTSGATEATNECARWNWNVTAGTTVDAEFRLSLYEGEYTGPWKPYSGSQLYASQAELKVANDNISSKVSTTDYNGTTVASLINQSADSVKIQANHVEISGSAVFSAINNDTGTTKINGGKIDATSISIGDLAGSIGGRNLLLKTSGEWSDWITPTANANNVTTYWYISKNDELTTWAKAGQSTSFSIEIEFSGVTASSSGTFRVYTQDNFKSASGSALGSANNTDWNTGAAASALNLYSPPSDGIQAVTATKVFSASHETRYALQFSIRCDYWASGKYRIRNVKYELGNKPTDWTPAPEDVDSSISDAAKTATNYITADSSGIKIHDAGDTSNYQHLTSSGTEIYQGGSSVASFGSTARIGKASGESRMELDYHSLQLKDRVGSVYFHVSDLRDSSGNATIVEKFIADGLLNTVYVDMTPLSVNYVKLDGTTTTAYTREFTIFTFSSTPAARTVIEISYVTNGSRAKALTFGTRSATVGPLSSSFGYGVEASGVYSHGEGMGSAAIGAASHAEGHSTASGDYSHAEGMYTVASAAYSHAEGSNTEASAPYSHAGGFYTKASSQIQTAIGRYNVEDVNGAYALIVGNGNSSGRSNALAVKWDGTLELAKALPIASGGSGQTATITESVVGNILSAASGVTINSASYAQWGKLAMLHVSCKKSSAIAANTVTQVFTMTSGKRPPFECAGVMPTGNGDCFMVSDGAVAVRMNSQISANTNIHIRITYLLA